MVEAEGTKFLVNLRGLKLPEEVSARIESQIQQIVKDEIAKLDYVQKDRDFGAEDKEYRSRLFGLESRNKYFTAGFVPKPYIIDPELFKNKKIPGFDSQDSK